MRKSGAIKSQEPLSGETQLLDDDGDEAIAKKAMQSSRKIYAYEYKDKARSKKKAKSVDKVRTP